MDQAQTSHLRSVKPNGWPQQGFNLIEVLVALLVLALGLLGMAALQNFSLTSTHQSLQRTQATIVIQDIIDKMRANPAAAKTGLYGAALPLYTNTAPSFTLDCGSAASLPCTPGEMAIYDTNIWMTYLTGVQVLGPGAQAQILDQGTINNSGGALVGRRYQIGVRWSEGDLNLTQTTTVELP